MWWDCPWRGFGGCCGRLESSKRDSCRTAIRAGLRLLLFFRFFWFLHGALEVAQAFAQALAQRGEFARAKEQERDANDQENFPDSEFAFHFVPLQAAGAAVERVCEQDDFRLVGGRSQNGYASDSARIPASRRDD